MRACFCLAKTSKPFFTPTWLVRSCLLLSLLGISPLSSFAQMLGDLDGDGKATIFDVVRLINYINGTATLSSDQQILADVNQDGY